MARSIAWTIFTLSVPDEFPVGDLETLETNDLKGKIRTAIAAQINSTAASAAIE